LAVAGRKAEAETVLNRARDGFDAVPDSQRDNPPFSFWEHNMHYTEAYVHTYFGEYDKADTAQSAALRLYPFPTEVELMRSLCLVLSGDTVAGVAHARDTVVGTPQASRIHTVIDLGRKVLDAVPVRERGGDEAMGLRELVRSVPGS
jgi:hypothetical protein